MANRLLPHARHEHLLRGKRLTGRALDGDGAGGPAVSLSARVLGLDPDSQRGSMVSETVLGFRAPSDEGVQLSHHNDRTVRPSS